MPHIDTINMFLQMTGCTDNKKMLYLTYFEFLITFYYLIAAYISILHFEESVTIQLFTLLCMLIECVILLNIVFRLYHQNHIREMLQYSRRSGIPDSYQSIINLITNYHLIASNMFVIFPATYTILHDSVRVGDPFTFPFLDVLPIQTGNLAIYACKYMVYAISVYIAHIELCFINTTFIYYVGVLKQRLDTIVQTIQEAVVDDDEQKFKYAIIKHQKLLTYFNTMKIVFAKPILLSMSFNAIYFGLTTSFVIQAIRGYINQAILSICIASSAAAVINITIYTFYGSVLLDLQDEILHVLFDNAYFYVNKSFKSSILIMMTRVTIPLNFTVGYIFTINLNLLLKIVKMSYTVLNVLLSSETIKPHKLS
ncbi:odorant receptor 43b-like [Myzus persicae]|uniref:odorant receptor 43b-like n=1 Tax=Myzus persicae TaxID=13164 RepID=UPI000B938935|nr:odorant receptor 43b-like [Myzus persicae]UMT69215.1 odorant receptor 5 [Myzus persicae]